MDFERMARRLIPDLHIIVGEEKTLADGSHLIGLMLQEGLNSGVLSEALEEIRLQKGVSVLAHPLRKESGASNCLRFCMRNTSMALRSSIPSAAMPRTWRVGNC